MSKFNKILLLILVAFFAMETANAGGIVTNTNQSAAYARMLVRDASTDLDAVYYNPAGLTALPEGLFISLSNQSIFQTRTITNDYTYLNTDKYEGTATAPLFPGVYAGYKFGDFVFSLGFNPVGGGGGAEYDNGLPSFHLAVADLRPGLGASFGGPQNVSYNTEIYFEGTSVYFGLQGGVSYKINDMISVFAGVRYIMAQNTYDGYMRNTNITIASAYNGRADAFFLNAANQYRQAKEQYTQAGMADSATKYAVLEAGANVKATLLGDQEAEVEQTGSGITPILGANFTLLDNKLNIGLKYELNTGLVLKNKTTKDIKVGFTTDYVTQFPDGKEYNQDIPALLSVGAAYKITDDLSCMVGYHQYFDKSANWDGLEDSLDANSFEIGFGLEYILTPEILVSAGFLMVDNGAGPKYNTDMSYSLPSNSIALGGKYKLMDNLAINLGYTYVMYGDAEKESEHNISGTTFVLPANYTFAKTTYLIAIGFDYIFNSK